MAKRKQLSVKNLPPKQKKARTTKMLLYNRLSLLSPYQGSAAVPLTISVHFTTSHIPSDRCKSSLRSYWHRPGRAFRLLADSVTIVLVLYGCQQLYCIASYIWKVAWENWLQSSIKPYMEVLGVLRWLLPCDNFVTRLPKHLNYCSNVLASTTNRSTSCIIFSINASMAGS